MPEGLAGRRELGRFVRTLRERHGWTLELLAERLETEGTPLSPSTLSRLENGEVPLALEAASALSRCLGTSLASLEEVLRAARRRQWVDLEQTTFDQLIEKGKSLVAGGTIHEALECFEAAADWVRLRDELPARADRLARALALAARAHIQLKNFETAREINRQARQQQPVTLDTRLLVLLVQIFLETRLQDFEAARPFAAAAQEMVERASDPLQAYACAVQSEMRVQAGDFEEAVSWLEKSCQIHRRLQIEIEVLRAEITLGFCRFRLAGGAAGLREAEAAARKAREHGFMEVEAYGLRVVGRLAFEAGEARKALAALCRARDLARQIGLPHEEFLAWYFMWRWHRDAGPESETGRCARAIRKLLPRIDGESPEARDFRDAGGPAGNGRRG